MSADIFLRVRVRGARGACAVYACAVCACAACACAACAACAYVQLLQA